MPDYTVTIQPRSYTVIVKGQRDLRSALHMAVGIHHQLKRVTIHEVESLETDAGLDGKPECAELCGTCEACGTALLLVNREGVGLKEDPRYMCDAEGVKLCEACWPDEWKQAAKGEPAAVDG